MQKILEKLFGGSLLTSEEASDALRKIASGSVPAVQIASFLTGYRMREVSAPELAGFRSALLELSIPLPTERPVIDLCGTGGDGKHTFNISTTAAFIVAASGVPVAKHGNYGVSSVCGSSNVLEFLAVPFAKDAAHAQRQLAEANITFLHAPLWHPAMKVVAPIRRELGFKTIFNILGPLVNPARPKFQLVGVHSRKLQELYAEMFRGEEVEFGVIHSADGYDEISLTGPARLITRAESKEITPESFGLKSLAAKELECGESIPEYAKVLTAILEGNGNGAQNSVVAANAAAALALVRPQETLSSLYAEAIETIQSGKALKALERLREIQ